MALIGSVTGSVNLGGASTFISSSNGSSVEIGAATQVLIMSGGGATSTNPRNFADVNFFVSGVGGSINTTTRGSSLFGGDVKISGSLMLNGDPAVPSGVGQLFYNGQTVYLYNNYTINPVIQISAVGGQNLAQFEARASTVYLGPLNTVGRVRLGTRTSAPTALAHITASDGTAGYAPLKFDSGSLLATPEAGTIEYDARSFYLTTGSTRQNILTTNNAASVGSDAFFFVSGTAANTKDTATGKMTVFGGAVVLSSSLMGGYNSFLGSSSLDQVAQRFIFKGTQAGITTTGIDAYLTFSGSAGSKGTTTRGTSVFAGDLHISGNTFLGTVAEAMATTGSALQGTLTFNTQGQSVFYVSGTTGNITANFTNVPVFDGRVVSTNVILSQSAAGGFIVSAVQINSVASTILWANGVTPTANAGKHDVFGFSLIRSGTVWTTLGQMSTYG